MLVQAILIGLIAMFVTFEWMFGTNLGSRPIITGMLVGLVMGDLKTGIILGATLEMVFIGSITLGAAVPPDVITGGVLGAAFAISTGKGADVALALAFPIATLYLVVDNVLTLGILLEEGKTNRVVALQQGNLVDYDIQEALKMKKPLDMDLYNMMMEISF